MSITLNQSLKFDSDNIALTLYISDGNSVKITGHTPGSPTILQASAGHCFKSGDQVVVFLWHEGGGLEVRERYTVSVIDGTNFSIPLDSTDCTNPYIGYAHPWTDLSSREYEALLYSPLLEPCTGNSTASIGNAEQVISFSQYEGVHQEVEAGDQITLPGAFTNEPILGVKKPLDQPRSSFEPISNQNFSLSVGNAASGSFSSAAWIIHRQSKSLRGSTSIATATISKDLTRASITLLFPASGLFIDRHYFYEVSPVGANATVLYNGRIDFHA